MKRRSYNITKAVIFFCCIYFSGSALCNTMPVHVANNLRNLTGNDSILKSIEGYYSSLIKQKKISDGTGWVYDSLQFPVILYLPEQKEWIVKDEFLFAGFFADPKQTISEEKLEEYQNESLYRLTQYDNLMTVYRKSRSEKETSYITNVKLFYNDYKIPVLGISVEARNEWRGWCHSGFMFYRLVNGNWENITKKIKGVPDLGKYFSVKPNYALLQKFRYVTPMIEFNKENNEVIHGICIRGDFNCKQEWENWDPLKEITGLTKKELKKICDQMLTLKNGDRPLKYKFDANLLVLFPVQ